MKNQFGGSLLNKKRKSQRPLDFTKTTHLVLRLKRSLPALLSPRDQKLQKLFHKAALKNNIKIYRLIFNHTHLHAVLKFNRREDYVRFIREVTSQLVSYFSKSVGIKLRRLFESRPFTRVVAWGKSFRILIQYMKKNEVESGLIQTPMISSDQLNFEFG